MKLYSVGDAHPDPLTPEDFSDRRALFGYTLDKYVLRAAMLFETLRMSDLDFSRVQRIVSFGCGPAPEVYGVAQFLGTHDFEVDSYDFAPAWVRSVDFRMFVNDIIPYISVG